MRFTPTYSFNGLLSTGIDEVPIFSNVIVEDDGTNQTRIYMKISNDGLTNSSTINDFINDKSLFYSYEPNNESTDPTVNDDITKNYKVGQFWINNISNNIFILIDNTAGSAVWSRTNKSAEYDIYNKINYIANGGETSYNIEYDVGFIDIFNDGNKMVDGLDFVADNGISVEFNNPLENNNVLTFQIWSKTNTGFIRPDNAEDISVDTINFNNNLSNIDNTVQKALDTIDNMNINAKAPDSFKLDGYDRINLFDSVKATSTQSGTIKVRLDGTTAYFTIDGTNA